MKITLSAIIMLIMTITTLVSCAQQEKSLAISDFVIIKYKNSENDFYRADLLANNLEREFKKSNIRIDNLEVSKSYDFTDILSQQIKDYKRSYIFLLTEYSLDKLNLIAKQNPKTTIIVFENLNTNTDDETKADNIKYITLDSSDSIANIAYVSAFWADNKEPQLGKVVFLHDQSSTYRHYEEKFKSGINNYNKDFAKDVEVINADITGNYSQTKFDKIFDNLTKQNAVVFFVACERDYFRILKKIQTLRKYTCGIQTDLYYFTPEFQDIVLVSEDIAFKQIAEDIVNSINDGQLEVLDNLSSKNQPNYIKLSSFHNFDDSFSQNIKSYIKVASF